MATWSVGEYKVEVNVLRNSNNEGHETTKEVKADC